MCAVSSHQRVALCFDPLNLWLYTKFANKGALKCQLHCFWLCSHLVPLSLPTPLSTSNPPKTTSSVHGNVTFTGALDTVGFYLPNVFIWVPEI